MRYVVLIAPDNKEIELRTIESMDENNNDFFFSMLLPITNVDDFPIYSLLILNVQGGQGSKKFFLCTIMSLKNWTTNFQTIFQLG